MVIYVFDYNSHTSVWVVTVYWIQIAKEPRTTYLRVRVLIHLRYKKNERTPLEYLVIWIKFSILLVF